LGLEPGFALPHHSEKIISHYPFLMSNTYFWQGGRRISIEQADSAVTIHAADVPAAQAAADEAGITLENVKAVGSGLVRATVVGDRDQSMAQLRGLDRVVHHIYQAPEQPETEYFFTDTFFIQFKPDAPWPTINAFLQEEHLELVQELGQSTWLVRVTHNTKRNAIKTANLAADRPDVEYAEPNLVHQLQRFNFTPADELFPQQWHLDALRDGNDLVAGAGIFAPEAWDMTLGSRDIVICVADDGFDLSHPDFQGTGKIVGQLNAFDSNGSVFYSSDVLPKSGDYHGTPCAGVALAEINGQGTAGVAPGCAFLAVRFPLSFDDASMIQLFRRISNEADVVSCSWGYGPTNQPLSRTFFDTLTNLAKTGGKRRKGLVICVAAGNNNCPVKDLANTRTYEYFNGLGRRTRYSGPIDRWIAAHPDVITVSGSTSLKTRAAYSSWGRQISVCAPTNNFHDLREFPVRGLGVVTTDNEPLGDGFTPNSRYTSQFGGTSSATPTVAGVCGLVLSRNPNLTALQVKQILQQTADQDLKIESETPVNEPGDFVNGFSLWFGHGKVNAAKAVRAAAPDLEDTVDQETVANLAIPDTGISVLSKMTIAQSGTIQDIRIGLKVTHPYVRDLRISLIAPDGTAVMLHDQTGDSANEIQTFYTPTEIPALRGLIGKSVQGTWAIRALDAWRMDAGQLNSWRFIAKITP
jgi:subtilisin family serine protease